MNPANEKARRDAARMALKKLVSGISFPRAALFDGAAKVVREGEEWQRVILRRLVAEKVVEKEQFGEFRSIRYKVVSLPLLQRLLHNEQELTALLWPSTRVGFQVGAEDHEPKDTETEEAPKLAPIAPQRPAGNVIQFSEQSKLEAPDVSPQETEPVVEDPVPDEEAVKPSEIQETTLKLMAATVELLNRISRQLDKSGKQTEECLTILRKLL